MSLLRVRPVASDSRASELRPRRTGHGEALRSAGTRGSTANKSKAPRQVETMTRWSEIVSRRRSVDGCLMAMALLALYANAEAGPTNVRIGDNTAAVSEALIL